MAFEQLGGGWVPSYGLRGGGGGGFRNPGADVPESGPSDLGMYHIKTGPEAQVEAAEIAAGAHRYAAKETAGAHRYASDSPWRVAQYDQSLAKAAGDMMDTAFKLPPGPEREATLAHLTTQYGKHLPEHMVAPLTAASGFREVPEKPGEGAYNKRLADAVKARAGQEAEKGFRLQRADVGTAFDRAWNAQHGRATGTTAGGGTSYAPITDPLTLQDRALAREIALAHGPEAGMKHYQESRIFRQYEPLFTPENLTRVGVNLPEEARQRPEVMREMVVKFGPRLAQHLAAAAPSFREPEKIYTGQSPWKVGP